ncbi:MAG: hypothetical protein ACU83V_03895 [Gammaproteobacteria bacterium]
MTRSTNKKKLTLTLLTLTMGLFLNGCTARIADLTLVSTKNIDLSDTHLDARTGQRQMGEDCGFILLDIIPLHWPNLKEAVDQALEKGRGNIMVDQVTELKTAWMVIGTQQCIKVEGTVLTAPTTSSPKAIK